MPLLQTPDDFTKGVLKDQSPSAFPFPLLRCAAGTALAFACSLGFACCLGCRCGLPLAPLRRLSCGDWRSRPRRYGRMGRCWVVYLLQPPWFRTLQTHTGTLIPLASEICLGKHETLYFFVTADNHCYHQQ